jgi:actin-like ATPase involved in cell morphogenesis
MNYDLPSKDFMQTSIKQVEEEVVVEVIVPVTKKEKKDVNEALKDSFARKVKLQKKRDYDEARAKARNEFDV